MPLCRLKQGDNRSAKAAASYAFLNPRMTGSGRARGDFGCLASRVANCWQPQVKGLTIMANSIYNGWRFENLWLDK
jgi:hypothetical protein